MLLHGLARDAAIFELPNTLTQPPRLRAQFDRIPADGYATTAEEMTLGACSVAVPIHRGDNVVAALGIVVPNLRRDKARLVSALQVADDAGLHWQIDQDLHLQPLDNRDDW